MDTNGAPSAGRDLDADIEDTLTKTITQEIGNGWSVEGEFIEGVNIPYEEMRTNFRLMKDGEQISSLTVVGGPDTPDAHGITSRERMDAFDDHWEPKCGARPSQLWMRTTIRATEPEIVQSILRFLDKQDPVTGQIVRVGLATGALTERNLITMMGAQISKAMSEKDGKEKSGE